MITLRDPTLTDCLVVCHGTTEDEREQVRAFTGGEYSADELAHEIYGCRGPKWVAHDENGLTLVVAGFIPVRRGVYTSFFIAQETAWKTHGREITRLTKLVIQQMLAYGDGTDQVCHRIERSVLASRKLAKRWYGTIGLSHESTMPYYGVNGETFDLYVVTKKEDV